MEKENITPDGKAKAEQLKDSNHRDEKKKKSKNKPDPSLEKQIQTLKEEKDEIYDLLLREKASFENFRKRTEREKRELRGYVRGDVINEFLSVYDNFERAMEHMDSDDPKTLCEGFELIYKQLSETLHKMGVKPVDGVGAPFDPRIHEAISQEKTSEVPDRAVLRVFEKGYMLDDRLLRPAKVVVASNKDQKDGEDEDPSPEGGSSADS